MGNGVRRFFLDRATDETGISGTGTVAQGVVWGDGSVALRWLTRHRSTCVYASMDDVVAIHGHAGKTRVRYEDPICFACGAVLWAEEQSARHCFGCGAGQGNELFFEDKPNPSLGSWAPAITINSKDEAES